MNLAELKKHKFIVIGYEHYNPLGVIRSLGENEIKPIVMMLKTRGRFASRSKYVKKLHIIDSYDTALELLSLYVDPVHKAFVIPCDDNITELIDKNYDNLKDKFYICNAGQANRISFYMNKWEICRLAKKHGLNFADSCFVKRGEIPSNIEYPVITKPATSYPGWKLDYYICKNEEELKAAYSKIKGEYILLQHYINKKTELCLEGTVVNKGNDVLYAISTLYTYKLPDYYSQEMVVSKFKDEKLKSQLDAMFKEIGYEGIFEVEFMVDEEDKLWFLEINFRNSTWSYCATKLGMNLPLLWADGMINGKIDCPAVEIKEGYRALAETADYEHRVRRLKMITKKEWRKSVKKADCLFVKNNKDRIPGLFYWGRRKLVDIKHFLLRRR